MGVQAKRQCSKDMMEFVVIILCSVIIIGGLWNVNPGSLPYFSEDEDPECLV